MAEDIKIDSHKLMYHPCEVAKWLRGDLVYPIEIEIGLSGACNHRCVFCAVDYMGYKANFLKTDIVVKNLKELAEKGLKSVIFSGEGEPLLHKDAVYIFNKTKEFGIDAALATNGVLFTKKAAEDSLAAFRWIRFSIAGATESVYDKIQRGKKGDILKVWRNLEDAIEVKNKKKLRTTLGAQLLLLPENKEDVVLLAKRLKEIGLDYLTVKPFSQHPQSKIKRQVEYAHMQEIEAALEEIETSNFKIYFRKQSLENVNNEKTYDKCYGLPFMTHIDAQGNMFPCVAFVGIENLCYGNIYMQSFSEIWESDRTRKIIETFSGEFIKKKCRKACRLDEINKYLYLLKNPGQHINFI